MDDNYRYWIDYGIFGLARPPLFFEVMAKRYWLIEGYDGTEKIFSRYFPLDYFGRKSIQDALRYLVCCNLSFDEVISESISTRYSEKILLVVHQDNASGKTKYSCGVSPYFTAMVVDKMKPS